MTSVKELLFGEGDAVDLELRIERLVLSVQVALQKSMHESCVSQKELAERLGVSAARVSQILSGDQANLTLRTIGKIAHALDQDFELVPHAEARRISEIERMQNTARFAQRRQASAWQDMTANANAKPKPMAA